MKEKTCKCGNKNCIGFLLLHEKELKDIKQKKETICNKYGKVDFELKDSPSSGELSIKFYELHIRKNKSEEF